MIYIRTDANSTIATGHMMRCKTIATKIMEAGGEVTFLVSDEVSACFLELTPYRYIILNTDWKNPDNETEIAKLREILGTGDNVLLLDSYRIKAGYTDKLADYAKICVIDDLFEEKFNADLIINYNLYHYKFDYKKRYGDNVKLLLGGSYVPLREGFVKNRIENNSSDKLPEVLLICGGGDAGNILGAIADKLIKNGLNRNYRFHIVAGKYNAGSSELVRISESNENIVVYTEFVNMAKMLEKCDLVISAASTVLYECLAMQVPVIFYVAADNQENDAECFSKDDIMLYAGDINKHRSDTLENIVKYLSDIEADKGILDRMSANSCNIVDGMGATRIAEAVMGI